MEFWGVEVKPGQTVKCEPGEDKLIHLSQAALGETKDKGTEGVPVYVKFDNQKLVIGTLSAEKCPQFSYDLVFEEEFELSHTSKNASVYFCGYKTGVPDDEYPGEYFSDFDSDEDVQIGKTPNGKPKAKEQEGKPKSKAKEQEQKPKSAEEDEIAEDDDDDDSEDSDDDKEIADALSDSDDDEDSDDDDEDDETSEDEDEVTPNKAPSGKKRPAEVAPKTPAEKMAKLVKIGGQGKKDGRVTTLHPVKEDSKTPVTNDKSKQQTPKSGSTSCTSCNKSFKSENALQAHNKAKHNAGK